MSAIHGGMVMQPLRAACRHIERHAVHCSLDCKKPLQPYRLRSEEDTHHEGRDSHCITQDIGTESSRGRLRGISRRSKPGAYLLRRPPAGLSDGPVMVPALARLLAVRMPHHHQLPAVQTRISIDSPRRSGVLLDPHPGTTAVKFKVGCNASLAHCTLQREPCPEEHTQGRTTRIDVLLACVKPIYRRRKASVRKNTERPIAAQPHQQCSGASWVHQEQALPDILSTQTPGTHHDHRTPRLLEQRVSTSICRMPSFDCRLWHEPAIGGGGGIASATAACSSTLASPAAGSHSGPAASDVKVVSDDCACKRRRQPAITTSHADSLRIVTKRGVAEVR